jgi:predicted esterase
MIQETIIVFSHGKESGPNGRKIIALRKVAESLSFKTIAPSYEGMDADGRVQKLIQIAKDYSNIILVGSSMGAYISAVASQDLKPIATFLLAPAFYIPEFPIQEPEIRCAKNVIVHGWKDELIPASYIYKYAEKYDIPLHLLSSGHRLENVITELEDLFRTFLLSILQERKENTDIAF